DDYDEINLKAALCVAFAGFLRSGELTWDNTTEICLQRRHISFEQDGSVSLTLSASKTDPFRRGVLIQLASSPTSPICPVAALKRLFTQFPRAPTDPLFSRLFGSFTRQY